MALIAAGFDEGQPFPVGHRSISQSEWGQVDGMPRELVVEGECGTLVADFYSASLMFDPAGLWWRFSLCAALVVLAVDGSQGIARQHVLNVHEQQLLVLLLVVK